MYINKIKNFVIFALVITAVYQTGMLWLGDTTSHNFFYTVFGMVDKDKNRIAGENGNLLPVQYAMGSGNKRFSIRYPEEHDSRRGMTLANEFFTEVLESGTVSQTTSEVDWEKILQSRCVVFQYPFMLPMDEYSRSFSKLRRVQNMGYFDCLVLVPGKYSDEMSGIYFINSQTDNYITVTSSKSKSANSFYEWIQPVEGNFVYASTEQSGFKLFNHNIFVPQSVEQTWKYTRLKQVNPFEVDGVISRNMLENSVDGFFKNLAADWAKRDEKSGTYIFSDESIVVKYEPEGMLEYYNYDSYDTEQKVSLVEGYQLCKGFMSNDKSLKTNVYLSDIRIRSNETIYYFDYEVNGFPIQLSEELRRHVVAEHGIEIVVRNNSVRKYRRYVCNFVAQSEKNDYVDVDFLTALDQAILDYQQVENANVVTEVNDIYLGYLAEKTEDVGLQWFIELYGYVFMEDTKAKT